MSEYYDPTMEDVLKYQNKKPVNKLNANMTVTHLRNNKINLNGLHGSVREQALTHNDTIRILLAKKKLTNDKRRTAKKIIKKYVGSTNLNKIARYIEDHANQANTNSSVIIPDRQQQEANQSDSNSDKATPIPPISPGNSTYNATNDKGDNQQQNQDLNNTDDTDNN